MKIFNLFALYRRNIHFPDFVYQSAQMPFFVCIFFTSHNSLITSIMEREMIYWYASAIYRGGMTIPVRIHSSAAKHMDCA